MHSEKMTKTYSLIAVMIFGVAGACTVPGSRVDQTVTPTPHYGATGVNQTPTPSPGPNVTAFADQTSTFVSARFEEVLTNTKPPQIYLALNDSTDGTRIDFPPETKLLLERHWYALLRYRLAKDFEVNREQLAQAMFDHNISAVNVMTSLENFRFTRGKNESQLSEEEIKNILSAQTKSFGDHYWDSVEAFPEIKLSLVDDSHWF